MTTLEFLPWQVDLARRWLADRDRFAHAWLIHGSPGVGQTAFAMAGAASLLCETPRAGLACGQCQACGWVRAGNHPDLRRIRPEAIAALEDIDTSADAASGKKAALSRDIRVEQIRGLLPWFNTATHRGGWRVALLYPAQALNVISANALLKILEEPPANTVFLLSADAPDRLLPTLVSRCRRLPLPDPAVAQAREWLEQQQVDHAHARLAAAGGAPLLALERARSGLDAMPEWLQQFLALSGDGGAPGSLADALAACDPAVWVDGFQRLWLDLSLGVHGQAPRYYPGRQAEILALAQRADPAALAQAGQWLQAQRRLAGHALNPKFLADHAARLLLQAVRPKAASS